MDSQAVWHTVGAMLFYGSLVVFVALIGGAVFLLVRQLRRGRLLPPFAVERAKHPVWYWLLILGQVLLFVLLMLVFVFVAFVAMIWEADG
jgi:hypothetical protein